MKTLKEKIEIARRLNADYNAPGRDMQTHREVYNKAIQECESNGIAPDIMQVSSDVFELLVKNKMLELYFNND